VLVKRKVLVYGIFYLQTGVRMAGKPKGPTWEERAARYLKTELKRAGVTYEELAERLKKHGQNETKSSIANKLSRGTFSAVFFLTTLVALGLDKIPLADV
jgi:hypothetical protein